MTQGFKSPAPRRRTRPRRAAVRRVRRRRARRGPGRHRRGRRRGAQRRQGAARRALRLSRRHGHRRRRHQLLRPACQRVRRRSARWCTASPTTCSSACARLDGLNEPHLVLGKIHAQAYDMSAFKCAADALLAADGVAAAVPCAGRRRRASAATAASTPCCSRRSRAASRCAARCFIDCSGDGDLAHWAGVPTEKGDEQGHMLYPTLMFRVGNVDADTRRRGLAHDPAS